MVASVACTLALLLAAVPTGLGGASPLGVRPAAHPRDDPLSKLADLVIDIPSADHMEIVDVNEEDEDEEDAVAGDKVIHCIAPPCGLKMPAAEHAPVPWSMRLTPPVKA